MADEDGWQHAYYELYSTAYPDLSSYTQSLYVLKHDVKGNQPYYLLDTYGMPFCSHMCRNFRNEPSSGQPVEGFTPACQIVADMSNMQGYLQRYEGIRGPFWALYFQVAIEFGGTELKASVIWEDNQVGIFKTRRIKM